MLLVGDHEHRRKNVVVRVRFPTAYFVLHVELVFWIISTQSDPMQLKNSTMLEQVITKEHKFLYMFLGHN